MLNRVYSTCLKSLPNWSWRGETTKKILGYISTSTFGWANGKLINSFDSFMVERVIIWCIILVICHLSDGYRHYHSNHQLITFLNTHLRLFFIRPFFSFSFSFFRTTLNGFDFKKLVLKYSDESKKAIFLSFRENTNIKKNCMPINNLQKATTTWRTKSAGRSQNFVSLSFSSFCDTQTENPVQLLK